MAGGGGVRGGMGEGVGGFEFPELDWFLRTGNSEDLGLCSAV